MDEKNGENIVISGISGRFPMCQNVEEFSKNLYSKVDMVADIEHEETDTLYSKIPKRRGVIDNLNKFDAGYFHVNTKQAEKMSPESRIMLELATEAILDAGISPASLKGSNTAVCLAQSTYDAMYTGLYNDSSNDIHAFLGSSSVIAVNRLSFCLGLRGTSIVVDAACAASFVALHTAINWIRQGESDAVLVIATNVQSHPVITKMFASLDVLNPEGCSRPFDENANGYVRSDTITAILLQKRRDAKRVYANIEEVICNHDGYKVEGITHPSGQSQSELFDNLYKKIRIDPLNVHFVEAHGTGTVVGDPEECQAIDKVFCKNRKGPLLVGSTKSNMGHAEGASGMASIMKAIFTFETGLIPPNINFSKVRQDIPSLASGRLKVCTEPTPLMGSFIAINVFGMGGVNGHALFRKDEKRLKPIFDQKLPTLVCWSGRTEEAVYNVFAKLKSIPIDVEFNALLRNIQKIPMKENLHRGYILLKTSEANALPQCVEEKISLYEVQKRPIIWASSGLGSQYPKMAQNLMRIPSFANSIMKCHQVLKQFDLDLVSLLTNDESEFDSIAHSFVGITAVQIALVDLLQSLIEVPADFYIGHSMGEICCAYADGALTLEQTIISSYWRGKCSVEVKTIEGAMAAVGLGYNDIKDNLPPSIEVACHNSSRSCTISGPKNDILQYVDKLRSKQIFAKTVNSGNIAFHSKYTADVAPQLLEKLKSVIPNKVERSSKWLSTSNTIDQWQTELAKFASAEYFVNNYLNPVYFEETCKLIPANAIIIEIAPHRLLQSILKKTLPDATYVPLTFSQSGDQTEFLSMALGKLYMSGVSVQVDRFYPSVDFPVSQGTPMISPLIKWNHEKDWPTSQDKSKEKVSQIQKTVYVNSSDDNYKFIDGHCIDGRRILPAASILNFVKDAAIGAGAQAFGLKHPIQSLVFENVRFLSTTELKPDTDIKISISIQLANGKFEVYEGATIIANGFINCADDPSPIRDAATFYKEIDLPVLNSSNVYKEFRLRGCNYAGELKAIDKARMDGCYAQVKCEKYNCTTIMDAMIQVILLSKDTRLLQVPAEIRRVRINVNWNQFKSSDDNKNDDEKLFDVYHSSELFTTVCGGIEMNGVTFTPVQRIVPDGLEVLQTYQFVPLMDAVLLHFSDAAGVCIGLALEKIQKDQVRLVEVLASGSKPSIDCIYEFLRKTPAVFADLTLLHGGDTDISLKNKESIRCESSNLEEYSNCTFIVMNKCTKNEALTEVAKQSLSKDGFLIFIDDLETNVTVPNDFTILSRIECSEVIFTLMQRTPTDYNDDFRVIQIDSRDEHFQWLLKLQESISSDNVLLVAQHDKTPGLLGLLNCLRLEPDTEHLRCIIIEDENAPTFDVNASLYKKQLNLQLPVNIYRNAKWGTYRHLDLKPTAVQCESKESDQRMTVNVEQVDGVRALHWVLDTELRQTNQIVRVQYAALNFCDRLVASGSLPNHTIIKNRFDEYRPLLGFECAGIADNQKRVMCFALSGGLLSTHMCSANADILLEVPANMSLRDAATIPFAYFTVYCSFFLKNTIEPGQSILINADCAFAGLAAIHVALAYGMTVFAAVSTPVKKEFLLNNFPQLKERNIGNFSDDSFEEVVMNETNFNGADFVFNSLPNDQQLASIRCLKRGGTFLELGKFDVDKNAEFAINALRNGITIQPIVTEHVIKNLPERNKVIALMEKDLKCGTIQPLPSTIFEADDVENAFKVLMTGDHVGKVLVRIRDEENSLLSVTVWSRALFKPELVYILIGGLGGLGLELADWMTMRGARKLVLCSRQGVSDQYQKSRIKKWESYGCTIVINSSDLTTLNGCEELLSTSTESGEIGGIFNLAVVLRDGILANQTASKFSESFAPKVSITVHLDKLSRTMCPKLDYFVVFSSFSCGYGNPGQSNYGMANSIMEKIMEQRRRCKLPGRAIQWSMIGDVGIVTNLRDDNIRVDLRGALPKRMDSCLLALDKLLTHSEAVVACTQVAIEKETINKLNLMESICQILCVDQKSITLNESLTHIGMDSLMAVEVRHMLQREFKIVLDNNAIKNVTIEELISILEPNKNYVKPGLV